jgi:hypothetical protein
MDDWKYYVILEKERFGPGAEQDELMKWLGSLYAKLFSVLKISTVFRTLFTRQIFVAALDTQLTTCLNSFHCNMTHLAFGATKGSIREFRPRHCYL